MRSFSAFLSTILGTLVLAALLTGPLYLAVHPLLPEVPFNKLASRLWQLTMVGGVALVVWRLRLRGKAAWGYGLPRPRFLRQLVLGLALGLLTMLPVATLVLGLALRLPEAGLDSARLLQLLCSGALTGLAVGFLEETFFRGLLLGAVRRELPATVAVLLTSLLYASLHFLARAKIPAAEVHAGSGIDLLALSLRHFAAPLTMLDSLLALTAVGSLLALARLWTGSIALSIGLHAGWVWVMKLTVGATQLNPSATHAALISPIDGFTGWLVLAWTTALILMVWVFRRRFNALRARF